MWNMVLALIDLGANLLNSLKRKPMPEDVPEKADPKRAKDLLDPKE